MSTGEMAYLFLVGVAFGGFAITLAAISVYCNRARQR
jgi:hypothetical protein